MKYFETKVVKVKKCGHKKVDFCGNFIKCCKCGYIMTMNDGEPKLKGNWINGVNIDKIKFPCLCRFDSRIGIYPHPHAVHGIGIINKTYEAGQTQYQLSWADRQCEDLSTLCATPNLKRLLEIYAIKIRKGKIIIYEEE